MPTILASTISINPANIDIKLPPEKNPIQQMIGNLDNDKVDQAQALREEKAAKIDAYYTKKKMKLAGHGMGMVIASEKYGLDPYMMAAIALKETGGGNVTCPITMKRTGNLDYRHNVFGWGSCTITFKSYEEAFDTIAKNLTGNNPATAKHYAGKDTVSILESYNPRHIVADYPEQIMAIMDKIENTKIDDTKDIAMK